jgi:hypothetical protein
MTMWQLLDVLLITVVVAVSAAYAIYSLSPVRAKRAILGWLVRIFGIRVFSVFSPRLSGCGNCAGGARPDDGLRKLAQLK